MLKECGNPSIKATMCWKSIHEGEGDDDPDGLSECGGVNNVDCGLFCASSNLQCAKNALGMIAGIMGIISILAGDPDSIDEWKNMNRLDDAKKFIKELSFDDIKKILVDSEELFKAAKSAYEMLDGLKGIADLVGGTVASGKWMIY